MRPILLKLATRPAGRRWGRADTAAPTLLLVLALAAGEPLRAQGVGPALGSAAPAAELEDLDGNPVQLLDYVKAGRPTLIEFWASWCENCEALQPQLDRIRAAYADRVGIVAVAVAVSQTQRRVKRVLEAHDPGYPFLWDGKGAAVRAYDATTTSLVVLLDGEGRVAYTGVGRGQDLVAEVEKLLGTAPGGGPGHPGPEGVGGVGP